MGLPDIETIPETGAVFTIGRSRFADNIASHFFIRKDPVVAIACGDEHSAVVCQTGRLFVFGSNDWGQLGLGHKNHISKPSCVKILKPEKVTHVACGRAHTLICTGAQKIFACGSNQEGQLGRESSAIGDSSSSPILIYDCGLAGPRIVQIAAGSHHSMTLTSDGGVVAWGSNLEGQLGLPGISGLVNKPTKVPIPEPVKEISAGYYHSAFLTGKTLAVSESGLVYVCGESESGKLGIDVNFSTQVAPKQMQLPVPALHVACGGHHTLVLAENGNIYCSGSNSSGQLGMGTNVNEMHMPKLLPRGALQSETIVEIACGESHSAILTESGKLFTCGDGRYGKLGLEENENNVHEVTFAVKYQELFVSNISCGGCHTILVGRRHEMNFQSQRQTDSAQTEQHVQKKNLPPLKLPVNIHNEQRMDSMENKSTNETDDASRTDKIDETPENNETNLSENASLKDSNIIDDSAPSPRKSSRTAPSETSPEKEVEESRSMGDKDQGEEKDARNAENIERKVSDNSNNQEDSNENTEMAQNAEESHAAEVAASTQDEADRETSMNSIPPPKPPRLKSESVEDTNNEKESSDKSEEGEAGKGEEGNDEEEIERHASPKSSDGKPMSSISKTSRERTAIEANEDSIEKMEEEDGNAEESEKAETDGTQDDADVIQSPAPRAGKMSKLFKARRQEIQNGTRRMNNAANTKSKSKTCTIL